MKTVELIVSALILRHESSSRCVLVLHVKAQKMEVVKRYNAHIQSKLSSFNPMPENMSLLAPLWLLGLSDLSYNVKLGIQPIFNNDK